MNITDNIVKQTIEEAKKSTVQYMLGCAIFRKKRIISLGHNYPSKSIKNLHPRFQNWPGSVHAEVDAIIKARKDLKGCDLLVVRINKRNELRFARPCLHCLNYINFVGIRKVYFSISHYPYIEEMEG